MPGKFYSLDEDGKQILEVSWKGNLKKLELKLNNKLLDRFENRKELIQGKEIEINHDTVLSVKLVKEMYLFSELELLVNGYPVKSSMTDPVKKLNDVFLIIMFIAAINLIFGLLGMIFETGFFTSLGIGVWNIIYAGIFAMLGFIMRGKKSMFAMISMIVLMVLDIVSSFLFLAEVPDQINPAGPVLVKFFLMIYLFRGVKALKEFRKIEEEKELLKKAKAEKMLKTPLSQKVTEDHSKFMPGDHSAYMPE
jgi:hypothetical protein